MPVRDPQPMDAGLEHTMLGLGARGKFVVVAARADGRHAASPREMWVLPGSVRDLPLVLPRSGLLR